MSILVAIQGNYGQRIVDNIRKYGPSDWKVDSLMHRGGLMAKLAVERAMKGVRVGI